MSLEGVRLSVIYKIINLLLVQVCNLNRKFPVQFIKLNQRKKLFKTFSNIDLAGCLWTIKGFPKKS